MSIQIVNYGSTWEKSHIEFATEYFNRRRKRINPDYIYWKFRGNPKAELSSFLLAVDNDKVIGQLGLVPCEVQIENKIFKAQWVCDLTVHRNYRGEVIGSKLYSEAAKRKITLGSDLSPSASAAIKRFGFKELKGPQKAFSPIYKLNNR